MNFYEENKKVESFFAENPNIQKLSKKDPFAGQNGLSHSYLRFGNNILKINNKQEGKHLGEGAFAKAITGTNIITNKMYAIRVQPKLITLQNPIPDMKNYKITNLTDIEIILEVPSDSTKPIGTKHKKNLSLKYSAKYYSAAYLGISLNNIINSTENFAAKILRSIKALQAIEDLIAKKIIHLDIKPDNLILLQEGTEDTVKAIDLEDHDSIELIAEDTIRFNKPFVYNNLILKAFDANSFKKMQKYFDALMYRASIAINQEELWAIMRSQLWAAIMFDKISNCNFLGSYQQHKKTQFFKNIDWLQNYLTNNFLFTTPFFSEKNLLQIFLIATYHNIDITNIIIQLSTTPHFVAKLIAAGLDKQNFLATLNHIKSELLQKNVTAHDISRERFKQYKAFNQLIATYRSLKIPGYNHNRAFLFCEKFALAEPDQKFDIVAEFKKYQTEGHYKLAKDQALIVLKEFKEKLIECHNILILDYKDKAAKQYLEEILYKFTKAETIEAQEQIISQLQLLCKQVSNEQTLNLLKNIIKSYKGHCDFLFNAHKKAALISDALREFDLTERTKLTFLVQGFIKYNISSEKMENLLLALAFKRIFSKTNGNLLDPQNAASTYNVFINRCRNFEINEEHNSPNLNLAKK